jgi:putative flippase GtrA
VIAALPSFARRLMEVTFLRYVGASAVALAGDMALFNLFLLADWEPAAAAAASYAAGIVIHWLISSRLVFVEGAQTAGMDRVRQKGLFLGSAFVGLGLTVAIVWAGDRAGLDANLAKLAAIGVSFVATYVLRKTLVFAAR